MSKLICTSAIDGAIEWVARAEAKLDRGHRRQGRRLHRSASRIPPTTCR